MEILKETAEIAGYSLLFAEMLGYAVRGFMYPHMKFDLEKLVDSGEINREEADYRLRMYKTYMLLPWPIGGFYVIGKMKRHTESDKKATPHDN